MKKNEVTNQIVTADIGYLGGALRLPNSRLPVELIYKYYKKGWTIRQICTELYPQLSVKEVKRLIDWIQSYLIPMVKEIS